MANRVTLIIPYYNQPKMLAVQAEYIRAYTPEVRASLEVIFIDDGSPVHPLAKPPSLNVAREQYFRTGVDVPWNIPFCRNLGASRAGTDWLFFTDMDHLIPNETLFHVINGSFKPDAIYYFVRRIYDKPEEPYNHHLNTIFLHRQLWQRIGGDDERLAGFYSAQETDFVKRSKAAAPWFQCEQKVLVAIGMTDDAKVNLVRKEPENQRLCQLVEGMRAQIPGWKPLNLTFPHVEI